MSHAAWVLTTIPIVYAFVRTLKSDVGWMANVPGPYRPWVAVGLGFASGLLEHVVAGEDLGTCIAGGVMAGVGAIGAHELALKRLTDPPAPVPPNDPELH